MRRGFSDNLRICLPVSHKNISFEHLLEACVLWRNKQNYLSAKFFDNFNF